MSMSPDDEREMWHEVGKAVGWTLTIGAIFSLALMILAVVSIWLGDSPAR